MSNKEWIEDEGWQAWLPVGFAVCQRLIVAGERPPKHRISARHNITLAALPQLQTLAEIGPWDR